MIEAKNDMRLVGERILADEWQTTATPSPKSSPRSLEGGANG